jgi:hypothetical protein
MMEFKRPKSSAHPKLLTIKPGTSKDAIITIIALITRINNPMVKIVIGILRNSRMGLRTRFRKAMMPATIKAVKKLSTFIPGSIQPIMAMAIAEAIHLRKNRILQIS